MFLTSTKTRKVIKELGKTHPVCAGVIPRRLDLGMIDNTWFTPLSNCSFVKEMINIEYQWQSMTIKRASSSRGRGINGLMISGGRGHPAYKTRRTKAVGES